MKIRGWNSKRLWPNFPPFLSALLCRGRPCPASCTHIYYSLSSARELRQSRVTWGYSPELSSHPKTSRAPKKQQQDITLYNSAPFTPHPKKYLTASPPSCACVREQWEMGKGQSMSLTLEAVEFPFLPPFLFITSREDGERAKASRWPYGPWREDRSNVPPCFSYKPHACTPIHACFPAFHFRASSSNRWKATLQGLRRKRVRAGGKGKKEGCGTERKNKKAGQCE